MAATWHRLGDAAGTKTVGLNRIRIEPGRLSTPPHSHGALRGDLLRARRLGPGVAGRRGLRDARGRHASCRSPTSTSTRCVRVRTDSTCSSSGHVIPSSTAGCRGRRRCRLRLPVDRGSDRFDPWEIEAEVGDLDFAPPGARPTNVVNLDDARGGRGRRQDARRCRRLDRDRAQVVAPRTARRAGDPALPLRRGGGVRRARRRRNPRALAVAGPDGARRAARDARAPRRARRSRARRARASRTSSRRARRG